MKRAVVLFTRDLRVHDHAALSTAVEIASEIVRLFVLDDALRHEHSSHVRRAFLLELLGDLRHALGDRELRGPTVHEPWRAPLTALVPEYPERILDLEHRAARA